MNKEGWTWLINATKWHYFVDNRSICGRWGVMSRPELLDQGNDDSPDNCAECRRRLAKRKAAQPEEGAGDA